MDASCSYAELRDCMRDLACINQLIRTYAPTLPTTSAMDNGAFQHTYLCAGHPPAICVTVTDIHRYLHSQALMETTRL